MFTRRIAALAAALLTAFTVAAATTGGTAAASPLQSTTIQAAGPGCPTIVCWRLPESPRCGRGTSPRPGRYAGRNHRNRLPDHGQVPDRAHRHGQVPDRAHRHGQAR
jgi:hypothetical protein